MTAEDTMKACLEVLALLGCLGCMRATGSVSPRVDPIPPIPTEEGVAPDDTVAFPVTAPTVGGRDQLGPAGVKFMGGADPGEAAFVWRGTARRRSVAFPTSAPTYCIWPHRQRMRTDSASSWTV